MNLWIFLSELLGTATLILIGNGVCSNVLYKNTGGAKGGIVAIAFGWGLAVLMGVIVAQQLNGNAELNPAVTMAMTVAGERGTGLAAAGYFFGSIGSQILGAIVGQACVTIMYWHVSNGENGDVVKSTHTTGSILPNKKFTNIFTEFLGTTVLLVAVLSIFIIGKTSNGLNAYLGAGMVALTVTGIGLSFGITGWAINPVRDFVPRVMYTITPFKNKVSAEWGYAAIPIMAPLAAGVFCGLFARLF